MNCRKTFVFIFCMIIANTIHAQNPQIKWWFDVLDSSFGQSAAGDIDKDGKLEIVFGCYRNDSNIYALNAENGSLLWKFNARGSGDGCNDVAVAMYDIDNDDTLEVIVPSSCNPKTFCFRGKTGQIQWQANTAGSDSPPTIADVDQDGKAEILHGGFNGHVLCLNSEDGSQCWDKNVYSNSWVQTAPTIVDVNNDGTLDFVVGIWAFQPDTSRVYAYDGLTQNLLWSKPVSDYIYHGTSVADLDNDNKPELVLGDYNGKLYALNAEDGSLLWDYQSSVYIGAPAAIADINDDGQCEVIYCDGYGVGALTKNGTPLWYYNAPNFGQAFRGVAIAEINADGKMDIVFGTNKGNLIALNGFDGSVIFNLDLAAHIGKTFELSHAPLIADFDQNGKIDAFIVGGKTDYPNFSTNYGRAYMVEIGNGIGPDWLMFQQDLYRSSSMCYAPLSVTQEPVDQLTFNLSPNPSSNSLQIHATQKGTLAIYSIHGQKIKTFSLNQNTSTIDISNLPTGLYMVHFQHDNGKVTSKFVKQ